MPRYLICCQIPASTDCVMFKIAVAALRVRLRQFNIASGNANEWEKNARSSTLFARVHCQATDSAYARFH